MSSNLPLWHSADVASKKQMDDLKSWGLNNLCSFSAPCVGNIPHEDHEEHSKCGHYIHSLRSSFETSRLHQWTWLECCWVACGVQDTVQHTALVPFHLQLLLLGGSRRILPILQRTYSQDVESVAFQPSSHLFQSWRNWSNLVSSSGSTSNWNGGSTIFSTWASRANFRVRVCRFTSRTADSVTPLVACSPTGRSRKTNPTNGDVNKLAVLRATIDGSPTLGNIALRYLCRRNKDINHDVAYSLTTFARRQVAAWIPVFASFATKMNILFCVI